MTFYLYDHGCEFSRRCGQICERLGMERVPFPWVAEVAIAPLATKRISPAEWKAPCFGTLIFHPSALPYRRGPDAIRHTVLSGERVSAATWFWCNDELDGGDICEQEVVVLKPGESAGRAYHSRFIPAGLYALQRAVEGIVAGAPRRIPQDHSLATYETFVAV